MVKYIQLMEETDMNGVDSITMKQMEEEIACLRKTFDDIQLIPASSITEDCYCFQCKHKTIPCDHCIAKRAYATRQGVVKFEFIDSDVYQIYARYVEIDETPYVMETIQKLEEGTLIDIDGLEKVIKRFSLEKSFYYDPLTGAYNRRYWEDEISHFHGTAGVAFIDIDDLKLYNDTYGHQGGDACLQAVVHTILQNIRKTDFLIRYGGDEFLLLLPNVSASSFSAKLRTLQEKIHTTIVPDYERVQLSVSIGGAMLYDGDIKDVVSHADKLMYYAKSYKNTVATEEDLELGKQGKPLKQVRPLVLIVDDSSMNRDILSDMLSSDYRILEAADGKKAISLLSQYGTQISLVLLDIVMPEKDGFEVLAKMNQEHWIDDIPVIMISSADSIQFIRKSYEYGASDYIGRPFDINTVRQRVFNIIKLFTKQRRLSQIVTAQIHEKEKNNDMMISILSQAIGYKSGETGLHIMHINKLTELLLAQISKLGSQYKLSWNDQSLIATASALHDIGKIGIDEKILNKPGKLTKEEFDIMKTHTLIGADIIKSLDKYQDNQLVQVAYEICRWHHERWDGKGYPDGLTGDEIPISAQVVALADVYDALVSKRCYKDAFSHEKAVQMILNGECGIFNPLLLQGLTEIQDTIKTEYQKMLHVEIH